PARALQTGEPVPPLAPGSLARFAARSSPLEVLGAGRHGMHDYRGAVVRGDDPQFEQDPRSGWPHDHVQVVLRVRPDPDRLTEGVADVRVEGTVLTSAPGDDWSHVMAPR